jgi:hypothetical protein
MHLQSSEVPPEGTSPLCVTGPRSLIKRSGASQFSSLSRGFGRSRGGVQLVYPVASTEKEKAEERQVEQLEAPLPENEEGAHLKRKLQTPPDEDRVVTHVVPATKIAAAAAAVRSASPPPPAAKKKKLTKLV